MIGILNKKQKYVKNKIQLILLKDKYAQILYLDYYMQEFGYL